MKNNKRIIQITVLIALSVAVIAAASVYYMKNRENKLDTSSSPGINKVDYGPPEASDIIQPSSKEKIIDENVQPKNETSVSLRITQSVQQDSLIYVRTIIENTNGGSCKLNISKGPLSVTKNAQVGIQASYAVCQGFNIPLQEFPESGVWKVSILLTDAQGIETEASSELVIKK